MITKVLTAKIVDLVVLVKPNIMIMALFTAAGAMSLAPGTMPVSRALLMLLGAGLIVGAANTLNMWLERDTDCLMSRTKNRPLPQHRLEPMTALWFGAIQGAIALPVLALSGIVPAALGLVALLLYVGAYTPMKQKTHHAIYRGPLAQVTDDFGNVFRRGELTPLNVHDWQLLLVGRFGRKVKVDGVTRYGMMTYVHNGHQYIMLQTGSKLTAVALPDAIPKPAARAAGE